MVPIPHDLALLSSCLQKASEKLFFGIFQPEDKALLEIRGFFF